MKKDSALSSFTIIVAFIAISLVGLAVIPYLKVKLFPSRTLPSLTVYFSMRNNSARIVEMEVTSKLEAMLARISGVREITSTSSNGSGSIRLSLDKHVSMDMVRLEASTIIRQTWPSLPPSTSYPNIRVLTPDDNATGPFLIYNVNAQVTPNIIQQYVETNIEPILAQIPGVFKVEVSGAMPMEWILEFDIVQLDALGLTPSDISQAVSTNGQKSTFGLVMVENEDSDIRYMRLSSVLGNDSDQNTLNIEDIFLTDREGRMIRLDQLVKVSYREEPASSYFRINGLSSIYIQLTATEDANQLRLCQTVKEEMALIKQSLPDGYELHLNSDASERINKELNKIYVRTILTILILLFFVFITTFNLRYLLLIVLSLFFNISIAFIFYYVFGLEIQVYSLAGITISLSLVIDNTIIMSDHYLRNRDRKVILSILAATLTTVGALAMIFFLNEQIRLNLQDFATVVIINLMVSLSISLLFVPALIEKLKVKRRKMRFKLKRFRFSPKRIVVYFNRMYLRLTLFLMRFRTITIILLVFAFGLPVFMIPTKIESKNIWAERYNKISTSSSFNEKVRPIIEKSLGGTLRLFVKKVSSGSYFSRSNDEIVLTVGASLPNGATIRQMDYLIRQMESYLSQHKEIRQFQTRISNARSATITIFFTQAAEKTGFPYHLNSELISKATRLGGGSWNVSGLPEQSFSNNVNDQAGSQRVKFYGYNYDDLYDYADEFGKRLLTYPRIKEVIITSEMTYYKENYFEYIFDLDLERMVVENIVPNELYRSISPVFTRDQRIGNIVGKDNVENIKMTSLQSNQYDSWSLANMSRTMYNKNYKIGELTSITRSQIPQRIIKEQQQYILYTQYDYIGSFMQANSTQEREIKAMNEILPLGYSVQKYSSNFNWNNSNNKQYLFLGVIILIIFFMTSILFNSLKQPLAIIFVIPVSYIGVFLTFYLFKLKFDMGGFASFVLLCGATINASIYLITEYNRILKLKPTMNHVKAYIKSWNIKIVPIFLTIISTILGFIPFMVGLGKESFWFPLAAGTIGGLIMSFVAIFFFLPLFLIKRRLIIPKRQKKKKNRIQITQI